MRISAWANLCLGLAIGTVIGTGGYYLYSQNVGNVRQHVVDHQRAVTVDDQTVPDRNTVRDQVVKNDYEKRGWQRLGTIAMPKLSIRLPIYNQPYNAAALKIGAQQIKARKDKTEVDTTIGTGNFILAAHNYADGKTMFSALQQMANKDAPYLVNNQPGHNAWLNDAKIYLANDRGVYEYRIDDQYTVKKDDLSVLQNTDDAVLNIVTCLYPSDEYRIITHARLVKQWDWQTVPDHVLIAVGMGKYNV